MLGHRSFNPKGRSAIEDNETGEIFAKLTRVVRSDGHYNYRAVCRDGTVFEADRLATIYEHIYAHFGRK